MNIQFGEWSIRKWRQTDHASLVQYANNYNIWINLRDGFPHPYTDKDATRWLAMVKDQEPQNLFAIATKKEAIGAIGFQPFSDVYRKTAEIGYWLAEPFWGRGIATFAVGLFVDRIFEKYQLHRIQAGVFERNRASMRVLEKNGFRLEGQLRKSVFKAGRLIDQYLYALVRE